MCPSSALSILDPRWDKLESPTKCLNSLLNIMVIYNYKNIDKQFRNAIGQPPKDITIYFAWRDIYPKVSIIVEWRYNLV